MAVRLIFEVKQEKSDRKGYIRLVSVIQDNGIGMTEGIHGENV